MAQCVSDFGASCEHLLMKYRKDIIRKCLAIVIVAEVLFVR